MEFKHFIRNFMPPLTTEQAEAIVGEHDKQVADAVAAKMATTKKRN